MSAKLTLTLTNEIPVGCGDEWAMVAPYGDADNLAVLEKPEEFAKAFPEIPVVDGKVPVVQRITLENAQALVSRWNGVSSRVKRWVKGAPIFYGHPDGPDKDRYPDRTEKGVMAALEARADGLYGKPVFNEAGAALLNSGEKLFFSARFDAEPSGVEDGKLVYEPTAYVSAGLTPRPNLSTTLLNSTPAEAGAGQCGLQQIASPVVEVIPKMNKQQLIAALAAHGVSLANDAADADITAAIASLADKAKGAASLANEVTSLKGQVESIKAEKDSLAASLVNEQAAHRKALVSAAVADGRITAAEAALWEGRLAASMANEAPALAALPRKVKVSQVDQAAIEAAASAGKAAAATAENAAQESAFDRAQAITRKKLEAAGLRIKAEA
jgi:hypothetical protein